MKNRKASVKRVTTETNTMVSINLDGRGNSAVSTGIPFLDHMLSLFAKHGMFNLNIKAKGDLDVDFHHTTEDIGIAAGAAITDALGNKKGILRYGYSIVPMDEALVLVSLDISGRPFLDYNVNVRRKNIGNFPVILIEEMLRAFVNNAGVTLHIRLLSGREPHHIIEAVFKALGRALSMAVVKNPRVKGVPSTKGII